MSSAPPGEATSLQTAIQAITMILQRKVGAQGHFHIFCVYTISAYALLETYCLATLKKLN